MSYGVPEGLGGLTGKRASAGVGNGARDHNRQLDAEPIINILYRKQRRFGIERIKNGFDHYKIAATGYKAGARFVIGADQLVKGDIACARIIDIRGQRCGATGRAQYTRYKTRMFCGADGIAGAPRELCRA